MQIGYFKFLAFTIVSGFFGLFVDSLSPVLSTLNVINFERRTMPGDGDWRFIFSISLAVLFKDGLANFLPRRWLDLQVLRWRSS
jgi:hypothetical protein